MTKEKISVGSIAAIIKVTLKILPKLISGLLKSGKVVQVGSAVVSMGAWSLMFSWQFALLIMLLLIVHESGHVWAMKRTGMKTKGIYFVPFLGGAAVADDMFPSRRAEVFVAIMGPIWGLVMSVIALILWYSLGWPHFAAAAAWMAMVNLFNLLPINPLDGGRILKSITFSINSSLGLVFLAIGLVVATFIVFYMHLWLFCLLIVIGGLEFGFEWRRAKHKEEGPSSEFDSAVKLAPMEKRGIFASAGVYLVVAVILYSVMVLGSQAPGAGNPVEIFT